MTDVTRTELNIHDATQLALGLYEDQNFDEAERLFRQIVEFEPRNFVAINGVALCMAEDGRDFAGSLAWYDRGFSLLRDQVVAITCNRARSLGEIGRSEEAMALLNGILSGHPDYTLARYNRGLIHLQLGRYHEAIADLDKVLEKEPDNGKALFGRGFAYLVLGNYEEGFRDYEHRLKDEIAPVDAPLWQGEDLNGKTILVHGEQGLGDNIMFMRYIPKMAAAGANVYLVVPPTVATLVEDRHTFNLLSTDRTTWPKFDYWVRFMSLAWLFKTTSNAVPPPITLVPQWEKMPEWRKIIRPGDGKLKVGLCWTGSPKSRYDSHRSVPLEKLAPLFGIENVEFFSIQKDIRPSDAEAFAKLPMIDLATHLVTFQDTVNAMSCLDIVLTVDTSVAHLAGSACVPTWVMLTSFRTYWLWIEKLTTSPWYPSIRLFRQTTDGDWDSVINSIVPKLALKVAALAAEASEVNGDDNG